MATERDKLMHDRGIVAAYTMVLDLFEQGQSQETVSNGIAMALLTVAFNHPDAMGDIDAPFDEQKYGNS